MTIWFEYWGCMVDVKIVSRIPRGKARYLCTEWVEENGVEVTYDYYNVGDGYDLVAYKH